MATSVKDPTGPNRDEQRLAELGYAQELNRSWSGFQNFAISFTIISVLAGCFTTYYQGWNNGGPVAISWGWPIISAFILIISFCMAELASSYPTAGGIYWWSAKLGGPGWGWITGWFNLLGLIAILASVDYFAGQFLSIILGLDDSAPAGDTGGPRSINALAHAIAEIHRYDGVTADFRGARGLESRTRVFRDPELRISGTQRFALLVRR